MNQSKKWQGVREGLATNRCSMGRQNVSGEKLHNWFTASISLTAMNLGGLCLESRAEPPCTPLSGDEWYDRVIFRVEAHYHAVSPFVQRSEREREIERGERRQRAFETAALVYAMYADKLHTRPPRFPFTLFLSGPHHHHKMPGCLQTRQLHCGQQSSLFLQSQLPITDTIESIRDIRVW